MEVIAGLVLSSILIAIMLPLLGSSLEGGRRALTNLPGTQSLRSQMDAIWQLHRASYPEDLEGLSNSISQSGSSGYITVVENTWVDFDDLGSEISSEDGQKNTLRVTLGNSVGERLTTHFFPIINNNAD